MRIATLAVDLEERAPNPTPIRDALQALPGAGSVCVTVTTDEGVSGTGQSWFGRIAGGPRSLAAVVEHMLKPLVIGADLAQIRAIHEAMRREVEYAGVRGLASFGISAVDTALWDCLGRTHGVPCWQLWGGARQAIPAYAMVGWLNCDERELRSVCARAAEQGFRAVKIKVGSPTLEEDLRRVRWVREEVGESIGTMVDANQSLTVKEALRRGRAFAEAGCLWWEEPIPADDVDGYATLAASLPIAVACGENLYAPEDFARFLGRGAVDIVQPDLRRAGGPTALLSIGALSQAFGRPYASHAGEPAHINVMATLPNAMYVETGLLSPDSPFRLVDGAVPVPQGAGFSWQ